MIATINCVITILLWFKTICVNNKYEIRSNNKIFFISYHPQTNLNIWIYFHEKEFKSKVKV